MRADTRFQSIHNSMMNDDDIPITISQLMLSDSHSAINREGQRSHHPSGSSAGTDFSVDSDTIHSGSDTLYLTSCQGSSATSDEEDLPRQVTGYTDSKLTTQDYETIQLDDIMIVKTTPKKFSTSQEKKDRRKELNRLAAKRSRSKKKANHNQLQKEAETLTRRNAELRLLIEQYGKAKDLMYEKLKMHFREGQGQTGNRVNAFYPTYNTNHDNHGVA